MYSALKILVVDDEKDLAPLIRQKFRREIRKGDLEFTIAYDGLEALEKLDESPDIDLILTDINMPRMDGLTLLSKLPETDRGRKAVVVTAYGDMENIRTAMNRGAFDFLTKPIDLDDLEITIQKARDEVYAERKAALVREAFGRYIPDKVVSELIDRPDGIQLGGEKRVVTIVMSDLRGFSTVSEQLPPENVVEILNIYLGKMADIITKHDGTIDEFIGDAILSIFGAPVQAQNDAERAVACAIEMQLSMGEVNEKLLANGYPALEMGIGIHTGEVVVGNIGSHIRTKYGVVGSNVNLASRIESYSVGGQVLISRETRAHAGDGVRVRRELAVQMKGFVEPVSIYELGGLGSSYDLSMPAVDLGLVDLPEPMAIVYQALDGKHVADEVCLAEVVSASERGALLRSRQGLDALANIRMQVPDGEPTTGDTLEAYAKVIDDEVGDSRYLVRFTGLPDAFRRLLVGQLP